MPSLEDDIRIFLAYQISKEILSNDEYFHDAVKSYIDTYNGGHIKELVLFDEDYYISQRGSRIAKGMTPIRDFFENGVKLRLAPHPIFDMGYIDSISRSQSSKSITQASSTQSSNMDPINPLMYILKSENGLASPNALFSPNLYDNYTKKHIDSLPSQKKDDDITLESPVIHYMNNWSKLFENNSLKISNYFDPYFYSMNAQRSSESIVDPMTHYFRNGARDRHDCNPKFHGGYYISAHNIQNIDPLTHFIRFGAKKGLAPNPYAFDELGIASSVLPADVMEDLLLTYVFLK